MATKYTKEVLTDAAQNSESIAGVLRYLGLKQAGGTQTHIGRKLKELNIDTSHFTGARWNKGKTFVKYQKTDAEILVILPFDSKRPRRKLLLRAMINSGIEYRCECGLDLEWQGKPITLEIDHINGEWLDNRIENLRFLCPNCHSQQKNTNMPHKNK